MSTDYMKIQKGFEDSVFDNTKVLTKCENCGKNLTSDNIVNRRYLGSELQSVIFFCECKKSTVVYPS